MLDGWTNVRPPSSLPIKYLLSFNYLHFYKILGCIGKSNIAIPVWPNSGINWFYCLLNAFWEIFIHLINFDGDARSNSLGLPWKERLIYLITHLENRTNFGTAKLGTTSTYKELPWNCNLGNTKKKFGLNIYKNAQEKLSWGFWITKIQNWQC